MTDPNEAVCFFPGISQPFQQSYFYYVNYISPLSMLLAVWCFVSNASVIVGLFRSGITSIRPGLLILCSLTLTDLLWGATVAPMDSGFRIKHLVMNSETCEIRMELMELPLQPFIIASNVGTILNIAVVSIDRYLAVKHFAQYRFLMTRRRALVACSVVWLISITLGTLRYVGLEKPQLQKIFQPIVFGLGGLLLAVTIPFVTIVQILTIAKLRSHNNNVHAMMEEGNQANPVNSPTAAIERQLTKATTYVVGLLALVYIPTTIALVITVVTKKPYTKLLDPVIFPVITLCSGINPILYYRGNEKVRQGIVKLVKCK